MTRDSDLTRRRLLTGVGAVGLAAAVAGCGGDGGDDGDDGNGGEDTTEGGDMGTTEMGGGGSGVNEFTYTFEDNDAVVGSALNGVRVDYPDGSGAVSDLSLGMFTLGGGDVSRDIDDTSASNNGSTYTIDLGGSNSISAGDELSLRLSNIAEPSGSYDVTVTVNPQSGQTEFTQTF